MRPFAKDRLLSVLYFFANIYGFFIIKYNGGMMKKFIKYEIIGFVFVCIIGTVGHFLYKWSGQAIIVGLFFPVNESIWEHLKLLFFPFLLYSLFEYKKICQDRENFCLGKYVAVLSGMLTILSIHYITKGALGNRIEWVDIVSFFVGTAVAYLISYAVISNNLFVKIPKWVAITLWITKIAEFIIFTFMPPFIPLFQDPVNSTFGI